MISHEYKCIFIHIQRTGGTSIENWLCGNNWWLIEPKTKHLLASQAKKIYQDYWDDYFKFSFVRNPWDRVVSCLKYKDQFGIDYGHSLIRHPFFRYFSDKNDSLNFNEYKNKYGYPLTIENDLRFTQRKDVISEKHQKKCVYLNLLDEKLDFIGRFENLKADTDFIREKLKVKNEFEIFKKIEASNRKQYQGYYNKKTKKIVRDLYRLDIDEFGYEF